MLGRYEKIFALGHHAADGLLEKAVIVKEKVGGSLVVWGSSAVTRHCCLGLLRLRLPWYHAGGA